MEIHQTKDKMRLWMGFILTQLLLRWTSLRRKKQKLKVSCLLESVATDCDKAYN